MADWIPVLAAVVLGIVLLVAGGSKIASGDEWRDQAAGLGAPAAVVPFVPWIEIGIGALLVVQVGREYAASAAVALLLVFTVLIVVQLARGQRPPCACFGTWSAKPLGVGHVARNIGLLLVGVVALF